MIKSIKYLIVFAIVMLLNSLYFEYCISRSLNIYLSLIATLVIIGLDIWVLIESVKILKKSLKL